MRKIPATMATQHPDNAGAPFWGNSPFVSTIDEVEECYRVFSDFGCDEYMWDWEGKFVDEAVVDRLFHRYPDFFKKHQLGRDKFLTFRIPNIWEEPGFRLARAYMTILTAAHTARQHGVHVPPLFEVILPMTTRSFQLLAIHRKYLQALRLEKAIFEEVVAGRSSLDLIPLIEGSVTLLKSRQILREYVGGYRKIFGRKPAYIRPFIARSDPALDAGFVPALLSARAALSEYYRFQRETGIRVYPIIGVGSLPFRGGLAPGNVSHFLKNYSGVRTVTLQSAFRYDFPLPRVKRTIQELKQKLPLATAARFSETEILEMTRFSEQFSRNYRPVVTRLAPVINEIAAFVPAHRERIPHTGHFGYSRRVGGKKTKMPRAIAFVASFASLGIPPSLIGTGRALREVIQQRELDTLLGYLPTFLEDLVAIGHFLNWENLKFLAQKDAAWEAVREDVVFIEGFLGKRLGPVDTDHFIHRNITSTIFQMWRSGKKGITEEILHAARVRRSLG